MDYNIYKKKLSALCLKNKKILPSYKNSKERSARNGVVYTINVHVFDKFFTSDPKSSIREAEENAAKNAYKALSKNKSELDSWSTTESDDTIPTQIVDCKSFSLKLNITKAKLKYPEAKVLSAKAIKEYIIETAYPIVRAATHNYIYQKFNKLKKVKILPDIPDELLYEKVEEKDESEELLKILTYDSLVIIDRNINKDLSLVLILMELYELIYISYKKKVLVVSDNKSLNTLIEIIKNRYNLNVSI